jgi:DNA-binding NarL/FixJ family response regulator
MTFPIRVLVADDHETVRKGLRALFESVPDVIVVQDTADAESTVESVGAKAPDLVVLDLSMPRMGGLAAIREIKQLRPETAVVVLSRHRDPAFVREALNAGAAGYVLKQSPFNELRQAVQTAARGGKYVDPGLSASPAWPAPFTLHSSSISGRESDVVRRTALGESNKEIARALGIAVKTVEVHKANAMRKLGMRHRSDLVRYAAAQGWLREP